MRRSNNQLGKHRCLPATALAFRPKLIRRLVEPTAVRFRMTHGQSRLCSLLAFVIQLLVPVEVDAAHEVSVHPSQKVLVCCHFSTVAIASPKRPVGLSGICRAVAGHRSMRPSCRITPAPSSTEFAVIRSTISALTPTHFACCLLPSSTAYVTKVTRSSSARHA